MYMVFLLLETFLKALDITRASKDLHTKFIEIGWQFRKYDLDRSIHIQRDLSLTIFTIPLTFHQTLDSLDRGYIDKKLMLYSEC